MPLALLAMLVFLAAECGSDDASERSSRAWQVADGHLVGTWERIAVPARSEIEPGLAVMDNDTRLVAVRSINGGYDVAAYVYDATTGTAAPTAPSGFGWRGTTTVVWTGERVLVIGGSSGSDYSPAWPAYDPVADVWDELVVDPIPHGIRVGRGGVWTGTEVVFVRAGIALDPRAGGTLHRRGDLRALSRQLEGHGPESAAAREPALRGVDGNRSDLLRGSR